MGGPGSGSWTRWSKKTTTDETRFLDIRLWQRKGALRPGYTGEWTWSRKGLQIASLGYTVWGNTDTRQAEAVEFYYTPIVTGHEPEEIRYRVPIEWTPCHFGGQRPWFRCPGIVNGVPCGRRIAKLYRGDRYYLCRHCHGLTYEIQREDAAGRARSKLQDLRVRLGGSANLTLPFPWRPRYMHWKTYRRLRNQALGWEEAYTIGLMGWFQRQDARLERIISRSKRQKPPQRRPPQ